MLKGLFSVYLFNNHSQVVHVVHVVHVFNKSFGFILDKKEKIEGSMN